MQLVQDACLEHPIYLDRYPLILFRPTNDNQNYNTNLDILVNRQDWNKDSKSMVHMSAVLLTISLTFKIFKFDNYRQN